MTNAIGWFSTLILLATLCNQVHNQWHEKSARGVSRWLFVGQLTASAGFITYSVLMGNLIFIVTNSLVAGVAILGEVVYLRNRRQQQALSN